ncbi:MAG: hypothetical protein IKE70_03190 [Bacilli bacterium]|nr:hypothetical protein [Bacilli bacterium]
MDNKKKKLLEDLYITSLVSLGLLGINESLIPKNSPLHKYTEFFAPILGMKFGYTIYQLYENHDNKIQQERKKELLKYYKEFLLNYKKLNQEFELKNPLEIFTLYEYLLYNGYLSKNKIFQYGEKKVKDIDSLLALDIINGKGVCRHTSSLLSDILLEEGIKAEPIIITVNNDLGIEYEEIEDRNREEIFNWLKERLINEEKIYEIYHDILNSIPDDKGAILSFEKDRRRSLKDLFLGNHEITYSIYDNKRYLLDPTNYYLFHFDEKNKKVIVNHEIKFPIHYKETKFLMNAQRNYPNLLPTFSDSLDSLSYEEEREIIKRTKKKYNRNLDLLEKFYLDNKDIYSEISYELEKTKVRNGKIIK